jgi:hypothetical protein
MTITTTYVNNRKCLVLDGRTYWDTPKAADAVSELEGASEILSRDNVYFEGACQWSHDIAAKCQRVAHATLVSFEVLTVR